jgi:hypothetical protein
MAQHGWKISSYGYRQEKFFEKGRACVMHTAGLLE